MNRLTQILLATAVVLLLILDIVLVVGSGGNPAALPVALAATVALILFMVLLRRRTGRIGRAGDQAGTSPSEKLAGLRSLSETTTQIFAVFEYPGPLKSIRRMVADLLGAEKADLYPLSVPEEDPAVQEDRRVDQLRAAFGDWKPCDRLLQYLHDHPGVIEIASLRRERPDMASLAWLEHAGYDALAGLYSRRGLQGLLVVGFGRGRSPSPADLEALSIIVRMGSLALENAEQYRVIEELSYTDSLTGLYNYRYFYKRLTEEIFRAKRYKRSLSLVVLDLDDFKQFNDRYGHQAGDEMLRKLAEFLRGAVRSIDVVCRYGGEEFCVVMPDTGLGECEVFCQRLMSDVRSRRFRIDFSGVDLKVTISVGAAVFPEHANTLDRLIYCADMAMYDAKKSGKNQVKLYRPEQKPA